MISKTFIKARLLAQFMIYMKKDSDWYEKYFNCQPTG